MSLSQTDMAASLGISPSYLNHLERNHAGDGQPLLPTLAELWRRPTSAFAAGGEHFQPGPTALAEIFRR